MKFSVITPTYNRAEYIQQAIKSIQDQTITDWEYIIIDDGSTDTTAEIIQLLIHTDSRIKYIQQLNSGAQAARNNGVDHAQGEYVVYLDSDDIAKPQLLEKIAEALTDPKKLFGIPNHQRQKILLNASGEVEKILPSTIAHEKVIQLDDIYRSKIRTTSSGLFHRRNIIEKNIQWDPAIKRFQDWDFLVQLGNIYPSGFVYIPEVLVEYFERYGGNSMGSSATYQDWADGFAAIYKKHQHDTLLQGQDWYPRLVEKHLQRQQDFEAGIIPAAHLRYFV